MIEKLLETLKINILDSIFTEQEFQEERKKATKSNVLRTTSSEEESKTRNVTYGRPLWSHHSQEGPILLCTDTGAHGHTPRQAVILSVSTLG